MNLEDDILGSGNSVCKGPEAGQSMPSRRTTVGRSTGGQGRGWDVLSERGLGDVQGLEGLSENLAFILSVTAAWEGF